MVEISTLQLRLRRLASSFDILRFADCGWPTPVVNPWWFVKFWFWGQALA